jgi:hypothetical protein
LHVKDERGAAAGRKGTKKRRKTKSNTLGGSLERSVSVSEDGTGRDGTGRDGTGERDSGNRGAPSFWMHANEFHPIHLLWT